MVCQSYSIAYRSFIALLVVVFSAATLFSLSPHAFADSSAAGFRSGQIIDDGVFTNVNSMSALQIQQFLNGKVPACDTYGTKPSEYGGGTRAQYANSKGYSAPFTCLRDYTENGLTAAQIIYNVAQKYTINPQVLLVLLQKEQGLVTDTWPLSIQYRSATGYGCPDTAPCSTQYYGLTNQLDWAAKMFRSIVNNVPQSQWYTPYLVGNNYINYNPDANCGGSSVNILNRSTQALYNYTPYQPNQAAIDAGWGTAPCGAYGNRNFFLYFSLWFGNPIINGRVNVIQNDSVSDKDGDPSNISFTLNSRPQYPVTVYFEISNPNALGVVGGVSSIIIQPDNWNKPDSNTVTFYGKDDGSATTQSIIVNTTDVASADPQFDLLSGADVGDPSIIVQSGTRGVVRLYSPSLNKHMYSARKEQIDYLVANGYTNEGVAFYACEAGEQNIVSLSRGSTSLLLPRGSDEYSSALRNNFVEDIVQFSLSGTASISVYRLINPANGSYFFTTNSSERDYAVSSFGYIYEGVAFNACGPDDAPVFRLYNNQTGHFYTSSPQERDAVGGSFKLEGPAFYFSRSASNTTPVYRLYNPYSNNHFFTTSASEKDTAVAGGFVYEGIGFSMPASSTKQVYRLYSTSQKRHFYTVYPSERDAALKMGYASEGVAFFAQ